MKNNKIPRICEILGVKPFEKFYIDDLQGEYCFSDSGKMHFSPSPLTANELIRLVEGENKIHKIPTWTDEDIAFATSFANFIDNIDDVLLRRFEDGTLKWSGDKGESWDRLPWSALAALEPGQSVSLADLILYG